VIAEVIPGFYDFDGKRISQPSKKRHPSFKGRPMGSYLSQPLKIVCRNTDEIRAFLTTCLYVSDREQFGLRDHWMPPQEFEQTRRGDCDDFALWTCRQLLSLGYDARFVVGRAGRYGAGHAWIAFRDGEKTFVLESTAARLGRTLPRLETLGYKPSLSVEFSDGQVRYYDHTSQRLGPPLRIVVPLVPAWILFRLRVWSRLLLWPYYALRRKRGLRR
jgi:hypothetical protein